MKGQIIKNISNDYTVLSQNQLYICKPRGKFRNENKIPLVGDFVEFDEKNNYILDILPRKNRLIRPPVANIDQVVIVTSVKQPNLDTNLLDKLLAVTEYNQMESIICLTKLDLLKEEEKKQIEKIKQYYKNIGYPVLENTELEQLKPFFKNKLTVFTGQSGAGKSTLLNKLDANLNIETNEISLALGRGKHTTRHTELIPLCQGWIADTPGFSSLELSDMTPVEIRDNFVEFNEYKENCKYRDCMHIKEQDCEIKNKVEEQTILKSRYENYLKLINKR